MKNENENKKMNTRKVRTVKRRPQAVRDKISKGMKKYWDDVTLIDEEGNIIEKKEKK